MVTQLFLALKDLESTGKTFRFDLSAQWLDEALVGSGIFRQGETGGTADVLACLSGHGVTVAGHVRTEVWAECVRCLEPARMLIRGELSGVFQRTSGSGPAQNPPPGAHGDLDDEVVRFHGERLFLDDLVRDAIVLEVPMGPLCSEDCAGMEVPEHVRGDDEIREQRN